MIYDVDSQSRRTDAARRCCPVRWPTVDRCRSQIALLNRVGRTAPHIRPVYRHSNCGTVGEAACGGAVSEFSAESVRASGWNATRVSRRDAADCSGLAARACGCVRARPCVCARGEGAPRRWVQLTAMEASGVR